ncbi:RNA-binding protein 34 [Aplysia californica]|uniref:RNA-binding protein 34 n=1 Tax=Aplysia californica TaxID=6500 RepID=A0ABM1A2D5_APLCA|nr:RNA-binding protein 34 [Aplysia californica]XP_012939430.1 RNA-binding protein 34 [Aplysia californica]XP_012939431.1 RNA-binding protein 34 [Aplysia californica]
MAAVYKPGQVAAALFSKNKSSASENTSLASLFTATKAPDGFQYLPQHAAKKADSLKRQAVSDQTTEEKNNKSSAKKRKVQKEKATSSDDVSSSKASESGPVEFPFQHETLAKVAKEEKKMKRVVKEPKKKRTSSDRKKEDEIAEKRPRRNRKRDKTADTRTVFIGNCPLSADKKVLKSLFKEYGEIESIRFRCAPAAEPNLPRRAIVITKNFHEKGSSYIAYIVFKDDESANKALARNGYVLDDQHLRVDIAASAKKHDKKRSVFVGNLPFDVREEELRSHFLDCGDIINVRIVRDRQTSLGKGICFIQFESKDCVSLSLKLNESEFRGRRLRVMACTKKAKKKEEKNMSDAAKKKKLTPKGSEKKEKKRIVFAPSNATSSNFKSILKNKKEKRLRKLKKAASAKKGDKLTSILGEALQAPSKATKKVKKNPGQGAGKGPQKGFKGKGPQKGFKGKGGKTGFKGTKKSNKKKR